MKSSFIFMTTLVRISKFLTNFEDTHYLSNWPMLYFENSSCNPTGVWSLKRKRLWNVSCSTYIQTRHVESESDVVFNRCKSTSWQARENGSPKRDDETKMMRWYHRSVGRPSKSQNFRDTRSRTLRPPNMRFPNGLLNGRSDTLACRRIRQCGRASSVRYFGTVPGGILDAFGRRLRSRNLPTFFHLRITITTLYLKSTEV